MKKVWLLVTMLAIVYFSNTPSLKVSNPATWVNEPKYEQHVTSKDVFRKNSVFFRPYKKEIELEFILHKASHVTFYSLLTYLVWINVRRKFLLTWGCVILFALTDEVHQYFVTGRSGRLWDVVLDSSASLLVLIGLGIATIIQKRKKPQE